MSFVEANPRNGKPEKLSLIAVKRSMHGEGKPILVLIFFMLPAASAHSLHLQQYYANTEDYASNIVSDI